MCNNYRTSISFEINFVSCIYDSDITINCKLSETLRIKVLKRYIIVACVNVKPK